MDFAFDSEVFDEVCDATKMTPWVVGLGMGPNL
jgi:hypothetical protein